MHGLYGVISGTCQVCGADLSHGIIGESGYVIDAIIDDVFDHLETIEPTNDGNARSSFRHLKQSMLQLDPAKFRSEDCGNERAPGRGTGRPGVFTTRASGGESDAVPTAMAIRAGNWSGHSKRTSVLPGASLY